MTTTKWTAAILATTALTAFAFNSVAAQEAPVAEEAPLSAEESAAQLEFLKAQVQAMQEQLEILKAANAANTAAFKAAPELTGQKGTANEGFKFKVRGRFMYDSAFTENPNNAIATKDLGFTTRVRRVRLGVEGALPGGFGYKAEFDFANAAVGFGDVVLSYRKPGSPFELTVGNFESLDGLEQITSSRFISFVERSQFNEAFNNARRLGVAATYISADNVFRASIGAFNDTINADRGLNDDYILAARVTYSPQALGGQLHFGGNYQYRKFQTNTLGITYQARPFTQNTDTRFISTAGIAARGDQIFGLEAVGIFGPLHVTAEGQYNKVDVIRPTEVLTGGDIATGSRFAGDADFFGFYAEAGYWFTGETRGFSNGLWNRTKVLNPIDKGGSGAWQINARYDYLDLTNRVQNGAVGLTAPNFINGGTQTGYLASLIWQPIDYVRFTLQYTHGVVEGGARQTAVNGATRCPANTGAGVDCNFTFNVGVLRAAFDF